MTSLGEFGGEQVVGTVDEERPELEAYRDDEGLFVVQEVGKPGAWIDAANPVEREDYEATTSSVEIDWVVASTFLDAEDH